MCPASLSHVPSNLTLHKPVQPSAPKEETQQDYEDVLQLAERKETTRKRMCCKHFVSGMTQEVHMYFSKFSRTKSNQNLFHHNVHSSFPPSTAKTEETTVLNCHRVHSYSKKKQTSNSTAGSKAIELVAVTHHRSFFDIGAYFSTQNITHRIYKIRSILKFIK